jgi:isopenicillin-N epimerase
MQRRDFLMRSGMILGAVALTRARAIAATQDPPVATPASAGNAGATIDWNAVKAEFALDPDIVQLSGFFLAPHPRCVRDAIEKHRRGFDANPIGYFIANVEAAEIDMASSAAAYLGVDPADIAFTDSTTMGLGLLYGGLKLRPGQEILTTTHDHYATDTALRLRAKRDGCLLRRVPLYADSATANVDGIISNLTRAIAPQTRILAVTWVHSGTGVRLPIGTMAAALRSINDQRDAIDRVLLCVDGVHGLGVEDVNLPDLGCDFFVAGTHKWIFGPRGTGLVWGRPEAWKAAQPTIPTFNHEASDNWRAGQADKPINPAHAMTPGGFHSFEHRWSVGEAFRMHARLGKPHVAQRIHALNQRIKTELAAMKHITLRTPMDENISSGIVCFDVNQRDPFEVVERLAARKISASVTPYAVRHVRYAAGVLTVEADIERAVREAAALA